LLEYASMVEVERDKPLIQYLGFGCEFGDVLAVRRASAMEILHCQKCGNSIFATNQFVMVTGGVLTSNT